MLKNISRSSQIIGAIGLITILAMSLASGVSYLSIVVLSEDDGTTVDVWSDFRIDKLNKYK